jgi:mono/diheme cytochrome c family protein
MSNCRWLIFLLGLVASTGVGHADPSVLARGRDLAAKCARCHAIGTADESPHRITPPFRDLGKRYPITMLVDAARTGVIDGHDEMPMFELGPDDTRALLAYIDSLNPGVAGYAGKAAKQP